VDFNSQKLKRNLGLMFVALMVGAWLLSYTNAGQRLMALRSGIHSETSASARIKIWETNLMFIKDNPVLGMGYRANALSAETNGAHLTDLLGKEFGSFFAHNQYLQTLAESGVVGMVLLVAYLIQLAKYFGGTRFVFLFLGLMGLLDAPLTVNRFIYPFVLCFIVGHILNKPIEEKIQLKGT
jgi:O-antigen ligase